MKEKYRHRILSILLAVTLILPAPMHLMAMSPGGGQSPGGGPIKTGKGHTFPDYGIRVSVGMLKDAVDFGYISETKKEEVATTGSANYEKLREMGHHSMYNGMYGFVIANGHGNMRSQALINLESKGNLTSGYKKITATNNKGDLGKHWGSVMNVIAWKAYYNPAYIASEHNPNWPRADLCDKFMSGSTTEENPDGVYSLLFKRQTEVIAAKGAEGWLEDVWTAAYGPYHTDQTAYFDGHTGQWIPQTAIGVFQELIDLQGYANKNMGWFTWTTWCPDEIGSWTRDSDMKLYWDELGVFSAVIYVWRACKDIGDEEGAQAIATALAQYASSGYAKEYALCIVLESVTGEYMNGKPAYVNIPAAYSYANELNPNAFFMREDAPAPFNANNNAEMVQQAASSWKDYNMSKGVDHNVGLASARLTAVWLQNGGVTVTNGVSAPNKVAQIVLPDATCNTLWGWAVHASFYTDDWPPDDTAAATFTWELTPKGQIDKTPDEIINEPSTITDLNVSQCGYNQDNYEEKWVPLIQGDGVDCNKLKITIYRISERIPEGTLATIYDRSQVIANGKEAHQSIEMVAGTQGTITIPGHGTVESGVWSNNFTDAQILDILKTGTGLSFQETIAGPIVEGGKVKGVRVTYAVTVELDKGCTGKTTHVFGNNQQHYVEYTTQTGIYKYVSDDPEGWAEIKCGYFDRDRGYEEPYEAMAGLPTTENIYFISGGQEFVAQIMYQYTTDKDTIRNFEQKYTSEQCKGYWKPVEQTWTDTETATIQSWLDSNTKTSIPGTNTSNPCPDCGTVHHNASGVGKENHVTTSITGGVTDSDAPKPGDYYTEVSLSAVRWDWKSSKVDVHKDDKGSPKCSGADSVIVNDAADPGTAPQCGCGTSATWSKTKATRYSGNCKMYHTDWNTNAQCTNIQSTIKFQQPYQDMNYAKVLNAHVWRLEKSRVEGISKITLEGDDAILADADELANVIFNVAENDTAKEGRMYYMLHPAHNDNFVFNQTLKTRGCCHCYNHTAAEDLIASAENPNNLYEDAYAVSDYLILEGSNSVSSLLYYEYSTGNGGARKFPICRIKVSGTDQTSRQDNGYIITTWTGGTNPALNGADGCTDQEIFYGWDKKGQPFKTDVISFNTDIGGGSANVKNGTEEKICQNKETFYGGKVLEHNRTNQGIAFVGYNGTGPSWHDGTAQDASGVTKYTGKKGKTNFTQGNKKIFATGYTHLNQGEVNGFSTSSPQKMTHPAKPFQLVVNDIDIHDYDVHNGLKQFSNSTIFYKNIISYKSGAQYSEANDRVYNEPGFHKDTNYSKSHTGINDIIIHNPVSAQFARLIPLPDELDQRTEQNPMIDSINTDNGKCPGKANACKYAHLNCQYNGTRFHTEDCYVKIKTGGLASVPVTGSLTTTMVPQVQEVSSKGSQTLAYNGARQTFKAPEAGTYKFTLYGAAGASSSSGGAVGKGAKVTGEITLNKDETVYIFIGGTGGRGHNKGGYNGGGSGGGTATSGGGGGGGMTFITKSTEATAAPSNTTGSSSWNKTGVLIVAAGGGGAGGSRGNGGNGGLPIGSIGGRQYGSPGAGATQSQGGSGGSRYGTKGSSGSGGSNTTTAGSGGGGGGAGYFGGGAGGNDYSNYHDVDDSGGGGGSSWADASVKNVAYDVGVSSGSGKCVIEWDIKTTTTVMVPSVSGSYSYDKTQADLIAYTGKPYIYTVPETGIYSLHLYGAKGGGANKGQASAGGLGGYAGGQQYLTAGTKVLVTAGGIGSCAAGQLDPVTIYEWVYPSGCGRAGQKLWGATRPNSACSNHPLEKTGNVRTEGGKYSGGYNGGGHGGPDSTGGFGGGGATDIALTYTYQTASQMLSKSTGGSVASNELRLTNSGAFYWGPRMTSKQGHVYRVDYYGTNLTKASFDTLVYTNSGSQANNGTLLHALITDEHAQLYWRINTASRTDGQEFRCFGNGAVTLKEIYVVDMDDRLVVAAGGGGGDNLTGTLNGSDDGRGGNGGGVSGENGYTDGRSHYQNAGATASSGYAPGVGQSASSDAGGGGGGWYGGSAGATGNSGGGGGSSNISKVSNGVTKVGQNDGAGYVMFVKPGKGETPFKYELSCSEPHHAPNLNRYYLHSGWLHEGGLECLGLNCPHCANNINLYSPSGFVWNKSNFNSAYIIKHDGQLHLTHGSDTWCDQCGQIVVFDKYTLDGKNNINCVWRATTYNAPAYNTTGATAAQFHYAFGDDVCYDPCLDDEKHKVKTSAETTPGSVTRAGQFVILDHDVEVYFPNIGDFYGNGALGIGKTQYPEGYGYIDNMDTTIWLREKYLLFPFDVTYKGHTYLAGEKVMLGTYDETNHIWKDDRPTDYKYTFHVLLSDSEAACAKVTFVARAKNAEFPLILENYEESRNYTRYTAVKRAHHDASKVYYIDVLGRIGVLSIEDTGDFRFSNYYKQALDGWRVNQVVHEVDLGKQNYVSVDQKTIFNDPISEATKGQNTWGKLPWMEPVNKLRSFPLTPGENNVKALKNQAHRIGYMDYMSVITMGNYYGENPENGDALKLQIQPYYYYYNLQTKEWVPVDVYVKTGNEYKIINKYGSTESVAGPNGYNFYYDLNWEDERVRRMYTTAERQSTESVSQNYFQTAPGQPDSGDGVMNSIRIPNGTRWLHGTANMLFLRDGNRTFIGSRTRYGVNTETDNRIPETQFRRQGQRWNFTLGLPTQSAFVRKGEACTPENIAKYDMENGIIVVALDIISRGTVWTLRYDGTPVGERSFYLFDNNQTLVSWEGAGENGPQDKKVVVVYTDAKTSRDDLTTEGTH